MKRWLVLGFIGAVLGSLACSGPSKSKKKTGWRVEKSAPARPAASRPPAKPKHAPHEHPHEHPHGASDHHHHDHPHPHLPGPNGHHHPY